MTGFCREMQEQLYQMSDPAYRTFQLPLVPTVRPERMLGVRVPQLRRLARQMTRDGRGAQYLCESTLPHATYDEDNLHAFLIEGITDYNACMEALVRFLPYIDNWATCDMMSPHVLGTQPGRLYDTIRIWLSSPKEFTVRYGLVMLMRYFLGEHFSPEVPVLAAGVTHDGYYVRMAAAWLFAEALARQWDAVYPYLTEHRLPAWTHRKAIQKALESRKLSAEQKVLLRALRDEEGTE